PASTNHFGDFFRTLLRDPRTTLGAPSRRPIQPKGGRPVGRAVRGALMGSMRLLWEAGTVTGLSDAQLLERSAAGGPAAELAFSALVERHGPMVLRVCRRVLRDPHDAQDAFQAAFLVLARRARSIRHPEALASWLHGVALRASRSLLLATARRRDHERRAAAAFLGVVEASNPSTLDLGA